jgi:hypothetical protein|tara:strand:- start:891 stop:1025 length:135 start_codon:yes stop_codon:yes gene_type:complete
MSKILKTFKENNNNPSFITAMEEEGWKLVEIVEGKPVMSYYIAK